jgi:hypothetical protein
MRAKKNRLEAWHNGSASCLIAVGSHGDPLDLGDQEVAELIATLQRCLRQSHREEPSA